MASTKDFNESLRERAAKDRAFRLVMLTEAIKDVISGGLEEARLSIRVYVNAVIGFERLSAETNIPPKSLMRMLGSNGNPSARNLLSILKVLQAHERVTFEATAQPRRRGRTNSSPAPA